MGQNLPEMEREFIAALEADTGRDLSRWMEAIRASGQAKRNDIIDWLRQQGFAFPKASWLERIHHNGGRLIYEDGGKEFLAPVRAPAQPRRKSAAPETPVPQELDETAAHEPAAPTPAQAIDAAAFLSSAKGLKPLADLILREISDAVPGATQIIAAPFLTIAAPLPFAALLPGPKELRLFADFGPVGKHDGKDRAKKADAARFPTPFPEVLVLSDARQIDAQFRDLVAAAYTRSLK